MLRRRLVVVPTVAWVWVALSTAPFAATLPEVPDKLQVPAGQTLAFDLRAEANDLAHSHIQAHIGRTRAKIRGNDLFAGAEWISIHAPVGRLHYAGFGAVRSKGRPGVELVVRGEVGTRGDIERRP